MIVGCQCHQIAAASRSGNTENQYKSDVESFFLHTQIISKPFAELVELVYAPFGKNNRALDSGMTAD